MEPATRIREFLDSPETARSWLVRIGFVDPAAAHRNFVALADCGIPLDLLEDLREQLGQYLRGSADADMAFNNFERMLANVRSPLSMVTFLLRKPPSLAVLLQLFSTSQYFGELIIANPEYFDFLWERGHAAFDPKLLRDELVNEVASVGYDEDQAMALLRRRRQLELLRIGFRDIVLGEPLDPITRSISDLADCLVDVAMTVAYRRARDKHGEPRSPKGKLSRLTVIGMGKLGGRELNYSSDIDLILIYDDDGQTDGKRSLSNTEFFALVVRGLVKYLSANTATGQAYRVDLRLRPHGNRAALCLSLEQTVAYYENHGRTWERQALVKARAIAGSMRLGNEFLRRIESFVYRRYLGFVEINEIKVIKRRIQSKTREAGGDETNLKTGRGGIRDIEFVTQFLQLVNGGRIPEVRERNTLLALQKLAVAGCLHSEEHSALETAYRFLRKAEHRLQFMFDLQTHTIPSSPEGLDKLARRLGFLSDDAIRLGEQFLADLRALCERNRGILDHLLLGLFLDDRETGEGEPETDLIMDGRPDPETIEAVLGRYPFKDVQKAYANLQLLAREEVPFLSSVRCRHFLAGIAPSLLRTVAEAPDPDLALVNLEKVTASLGGKSVLWESFSINQKLLRLYVNLCSWSQFLSEILINNPGMIDELLDALVMNRPPTLDALRTELGSLLRGAREVDPILHSFKNTHLLQIGVHDILGKHALRRTMHELSNLAEVLIGWIADHHWDELARKHGPPMLEADPERTADYALVGLGKFGGGELGYHSDLDLVIVYEGDGMTTPTARRPGVKPTSNFHFYTKLAQRLARTAGQIGPLGRLYEIDLRLRPTGRSGSLVAPLEKYEAYYRTEGGAAFWERMALTRARVVHGPESFRTRIAGALRRALCREPWDRRIADEVIAMREKLVTSRSGNDLKRGVGGIVDVEFAVQTVQLRYGVQYPEILRSNVWEATEAIGRVGLWDPVRIKTLTDGYTFLRTVESRLRIVHNVSRDDLPEDPADLAALAYRTGYEGPDAVGKFRQDIESTTGAIRQAFLKCIREAKDES